MQRSQILQQQQQQQQQYNRNAIISSVPFNDKPINYSIQKRFWHGSRHEFRV